jgi:hypothetical protein
MEQDMLLYSAQKQNPEVTTSRERRIAMQAHPTAYKGIFIVLPAILHLTLAMSGSAQAESLKSLSSTRSPATPLDQLETAQPRLMPKPTLAAPAIAYKTTKATPPLHATKKTRILQTRSTTSAITSAARHRLGTAPDLFIGPIEESRKPLQPEDRMVGPAVASHYTSDTHPLEEVPPFAAIRYFMPKPENESYRMDLATQEILHGGN